MSAPTEWKTIKISAATYEKALELRDRLTRRGTDSLPPTLRDLPIDGVGIGSTVALGLAALEHALGAAAKRRRS
ncbi:MAG: hypothetical protein KC464_10325 [Myxococcales bacterium]|nr:hypothetical protein [Myxococcales bacterium]